MLAIDSNYAVSRNSSGIQNKCNLQKAEFQLWNAFKKISQKAFSFVEFTNVLTFIGASTFFMNPHFAYYALNLYISSFTSLENGALQNMHSVLSFTD